MATVFAEGAAGAGEAGEQRRQWIAVVTRATGANGTRWVSDLSLQNLCSSSNRVTMILRCVHGACRSEVRLVVPPLASTRFEDVVEEAFGLNSVTGSLEIRSEGALAVESRTSTSCGEGSCGQSFGGMFPEEGLVAGSSAALIALQENPSYRTNLLLLNMGSDPASGSLTFYDEDGQPIGSNAWHLDPGELWQEFRPLFHRFGRNDVENGSVRLELDSGEGVAGFASRVDNSSGDPTALAMKAVPLCVDADDRLWRPQASSRSVGSYLHVDDWVDERRNTDSDQEPWRACAGQSYGSPLPTGNAGGNEVCHTSRFLGDGMIFESKGWAWSNGTGFSQAQTKASVVFEVSEAAVSWELWGEWKGRERSVGSNLEFVLTNRSSGAELGRLDVIDGARQLFFDESGDLPPGRYLLTVAASATALDTETDFLVRCELRLRSR